MSGIQNQVSGKWTELKGEVQKLWGKLTNDELEQTKGDMTAIKGLVEQRYGKFKQDSEDQFNNLFKKFKDSKESVVGDVKDKLKH